MLRSEMRAMRRSLIDRAERSERIWSFVKRLDAVVGARVVMVFSSVPGEPETDSFIAWCEANGKLVLLPEQNPQPDSVDVVIVPGTAFTAAGDRLGQGGGWYDRFLLGIRPDCVTIGVGFEPQLVDALPTEAHDVRLDRIVTDAGPASV